MALSVGASRRNADCCRVKQRALSNLTNCKKALWEEMLEKADYLKKKKKKVWRVALKYKMRGSPSCTQADLVNFASS